MSHGCLGWYSPYSPELPTLIAHYTGNYSQTINNKPTWGEQIGIGTRGLQSLFPVKHNL